MTHRWVSRQSRWNNNKGQKQHDVWCVGCGACCSGITDAALAEIKVSNDDCHGFSNEPEFALDTREYRGQHYDG